MPEAGGSGEISIALANAAFLALWAALPVLLFGYLWHSCAAGRIGLTFTLRKFEAVELDHALAAYAKVCHRIGGIGEQPRGIRDLWRELFGCTCAVDAEHADLQAHAEHLRAAIGRLRRRPLQRLKGWIHLRSAQYALGWALAVHILGLTAILTTAFRVSGVSAWAATAADHAFVWYPFDPRLFYANAAAAACAAATAPLFYLAQRAALRRERRLELCIFRELATSDLNCSADRAAPYASAPYYPEVGREVEDFDWSAVLGLPCDATIEDVKDAYKTLIKQNHPDRVQGMSTAFRRLADTETKKINTAYRQALAAARCDPRHGMAHSDAAA